jgi:hypothetical protein
MRRVGCRDGGDGGGSRFNTIMPRPLEGDFLFPPSFLDSQPYKGTQCSAHRSRQGKTKRRRLREHRRSRCPRHSTELSRPSRPGTKSKASYFCGVVGTAAPLVLPRSREGGSRSQRSRHSAENRRKSRRDPIELRVESALACPRRKIWEKRTVPAPIVEPTWAALGTTKNNPVHQMAGKIKRDPAVRGESNACFSPWLFRGLLLPLILSPWPKNRRALFLTRKGQ